MPARFPAHDEGIEAALSAVYSAAQPDPLFVRRLRTESVNRFVAVREGIDHPITRPRQRGVMGNLGRACLYASFVLGVSSASVLAAAHEALPGDALYALKIRVEQVRLEVLPEHLHDDLYADVLGHRIAEMSLLAERGQGARVLAMVPVVEDAYARFRAALLADEGRGDGGSKDHLVMLQGLIERLPDGARSAIQTVIDRAEERGALDIGGGADERHTDRGSQGGPNAGADRLQRTDPPRQADAAPRPDRSPRPERTAVPDSSSEGPSSSSDRGPNAEAAD